MADLTDYQVVLLDIEGTTTPINFVYEVLFPYAQRELQNYLDQHWNNPHIQEDIDELMDHMAEAPRDDKGRRDPDTMEDQSNVEAFRSEVLQRISKAMENDEKHPPLKSLQGRIWQSGYEEGELKAPLYDDVERALKTWKEEGKPVYIYSSGSVEAQKLLFRYSDKGDLREYLSGYFDTHTGNKKEAQSYRAISDEIDAAPGDILFVTDNLDEATAADEAGLQVALSKRPNNPELDEHVFPVIESFDELS